MSLYLKKVDAIQFTLTDEQKAMIKDRKVIMFEGAQAKHIGGNLHIALLQQGENLIKIHETQWLVRHSDGLLQIFWPDQFGGMFIKGNEPEALSAINDLFKAKKAKNPI
jgi:hypothetical protein